LNILFVTSRLPGRLKGDRVRAYHQLRLLGRRHRITLVTFIGPDERAADAGDLADSCAEIVTVPLSVGRMAASLVRGALSTLPLQVALYEHPRMHRAIRDALRRHSFDVAHVQLARMAPYLATLRTLPRVVDLVDALSLNMQRRTRYDRGLGRWVSRLEARRLARYERTICDSVDRALVGSAIDRQALGSPPRLTVVTNGVDLGSFPFSRAGREPATVVFSGNMGYFPNVLAALWLVGTIRPLIESAVPGVRIEIVGARPDARLRRAAAENPSITLAGDVPDVAPHLARATVAAAPMQAGSGQQFKVLEAMASGAPLVATSLAASGIEARHGEHLLVADTAEAFAAHVVRILRDPALADSLAANGRRLVEDRYTWDRSVADLERIYVEITTRRPA
jgi:sugar transferase (PEP-CTERM/EpsH1 system associated)